MACYTLPPEMFGFFKAHIDFITEHAVDPDKRRYSDPEEAARHYIDIDHYGEHAIDSMPMYWKDAVNKYTEDTLKAYGIVPWRINSMMFQMTEAFKEKDIDRILYVATNMGHYVGDAHVPLHCTENYNGQMTNQVGIHGFWESRIPELYGDDYDYFCGRAAYIGKVQEGIWGIIRQSFAALDSVLLFEKQLSLKFDSDKKYSFEQRGGTTQRVYSAEFSKAYSDMLSGMQERRMRAAIIMLGSLWYTAWVNAGSPNLDDLLNKEITNAMKEKLQEEEKLWNKGEVKSREHEH